MEIIIYILIGIVVGLIIMSTYIGKYFDKNPYEIKWRGKTYVLVDKFDTDDNHITEGI